MSNLFSSFDPHAALGLSLNWIACVISLALLPNFFWISGTQIQKTFIFLQNFIVTEFSAMMAFSKAPLGSVHMTLSLFVFLLITNMSGLLPYIFPASSHLPFAIILALPLWIGHMANAWVNTFNHMMAHLVPLGTPVVLMPFMVLIEIVSSVIRPLTLSIRLVANIVAGHLLLTLLGSSANSMPFLAVLTVVLVMILLCFLESGVSLVQAYVFSALSTLYLSEVSNNLKPMWK